MSVDRMLRLLLRTLLLAIVALPAAVGQVRYEPIPVLRASSILSAALRVGPHHRVRERVESDGYINIYRIDSRYGEFEAVSNAVLRMRVHEIAAIAVMEDIRESRAFRDAAAEAGIDTAQGLGNLIVRPKATLSGALGGMRRMVARLGEALHSRRSHAEDESWKSLVGFTGVKAELASELGVDPYSSNAVLQSYLDEIAWSAYAGGLSVAAAKALIPGFAGLAIGVSSRAGSLNELLAATPPADLRAMNREKLVALGVRADHARLFVDNAYFSPPQQTLIVDALEHLHGVRDRDAFIRFAVPTYDERVALFRQRMAQLYAVYHQRVRPVVQILAVGNLVAVRTVDDGMIVAVPADYLVYTPSLERIVSKYERFAEAHRWVRARQIWVGGRMSSFALRSLERRGWLIVENADSRLRRE